MVLHLYLHIHLKRFEHGHRRSTKISKDINNFIDKKKKKKKKSKSKSKKKKKTAEEKA
jgi:hypothetical protein